jgi:hypothetical protein
VDISRETVQLGDNERGALLPAEPKRGSERGSVAALAALDLDNLSEQLPVSSIEKFRDGRSLSL